MKRFVGIGAVWFGCALAWVVLGSTLLARSGESSAALSPEVHQLFGPPLEQVQPAARFMDTQTTRSTRTVVDAQGNSSTQTSATEEPVEVPIPLVGSDLAVDLALEHRRRGLMWFPTFEVSFRGRYTFVNDDAQARDVMVSFPLQSQHALYDGFRVEDAAGHEVATQIGGTSARGATRDEWAPAGPGAAHWRVHLEPGERVSYDVRYRSRGTGTWHYRMSYGTTRVDDFRMTMTTDFAEVDFPAGTLSPSQHGPREGGWQGTWAFDSLIANQPIGVEPPTRINPGPLAARITFFAPVGLLFFFFVVAVLAVAKERDLHPMHFFFLGCSFFAFHLLFAYMVDHASIFVSFGLSAGVSLALVVTYARLFVGWRFALVEIGLSQLIYLVLFSGTFLWEGFTGLAITVGAILTLFVMMQITGRTAWRRAKPAADVPEPSGPGPMTGPSAVPRTF